MLTWSDVNETSTAADAPSPRSGGNATEPESLPRGASKVALRSAVDATSETPICTRPASTFVAASPTRDSFNMRWPSPPSESRRSPYSAWDVPFAAAAAFESPPAPVVAAPSVSCRSMALKSEEQVRTSVVLVLGLIGSEIPSDELTTLPTNLDAFCRCGLRHLIHHLHHRLYGRRRLAHGRRRHGPGSCRAAHELEHVLAHLDGLLRIERARALGLARIQAEHQGGARLRRRLRVSTLQRPPAP